MPYNVITIARTLGAGGEELGKSLAVEFGKRYIDSEIIERAAILAGVTTSEVARAEGRKGIMQRILENLAKIQRRFRGVSRGYKAVRNARF